MTPQEIYDDMLTRCWEVDTLERQGLQGDSDAGIGHLILAQSGHMLAIEVGIASGGSAYAVVRMFGPHGEELDPQVLKLAGAVMAVTPDA